MRFAPCVLLFASLASAAPVPGDVKADKERLDALWKDLTSKDQIVRVRATLALIDEPGAITFLARKAPPVTASARELKEWLTALNSDDEKEWKPAAEKLRYFDPGIGLTPAEQVELVDTIPGRQRLFEVWSRGTHGVAVPSYFDRAQAVTITLKEDSGGTSARFVFDITEPGGQQQQPVEGVYARRVKDLHTPAWWDAVSAVEVLALIDTKASREALARIAGGHPDALPTRTAAELLQAKRPGSTFDTIWEFLLSTSSWDHLDRVRGVLALAADPNKVKVLKEKLPAIKATEDQVRGWLKALDSDDAKVWVPAFEQLLYFRPLVALDWKGQCEAVSTDRGKTALYLLWWNGYDVPTGFVPREQVKLTPSPDGIHCSGIRAGGERDNSSVRIGGLGDVRCYQWQRVRLAILALERAGSADAKAVLKQLADGHPDILPTKEAKASLERLK